MATREGRGSVFAASYRVLVKLTDIRSRHPRIALTCVKGSDSRPLARDSVLYVLMMQALRVQVGLNASQERMTTMQDTESEPASHGRRIRKRSYPYRI
jgi:hypothetical protein